MMNVRATTIVLVFAAALAILVPLQAKADTLSEQRSFYVNNSFDTYNRTRVTATLRVVTNNLYVYTDDHGWNLLTQSQRDTYLQRIQALAGDFDSRIYPITTSIWGSEPRPGIDGDSHITILFHPMHAGNGGYFDSVHSYAADAGRMSNEREMIFLNIESLNSELLGVFLGHELQHLISTNQKDLLKNTAEEVWLNELRSEYTATLLGQNTPYSNSSLSRRVQSFLRNPSDSLTEWTNAATDYGTAAVFAEYLTGRYGSQVLSSTLQSSSAGIASIDHYLADRGLPERFSDIFLDWMVASYLNVSGDIRYSYQNPNLQSLRVRPNLQSAVYGLGSTATLLAGIKYWQPVWLELLVTPGNAAGLKLDVTANISAVPAAALVVAYSDGSYEVQKVSLSAPYYLPAQKDGKVVTKVVLVGTYTGQQSGFSTNVGSNAFSVTATMIDANALVVGQTEPRPIPTPPASSTTGITDGALIKRNNGEVETYVIRGNYRRYLRPEIIALYGHLDPSKTIATDAATFEGYKAANYVRYVNDSKVYAVWPDGTKHWLRMSAEQFTASGRDWGAIFVINEAEFKAYKTGVDITR